MSRTCQKCRYFSSDGGFYQSGPQDHERWDGHCHFNPPQPKTKSDPRGGTTTVWRFPTVRNSDGCGQWKRSDAKELSSRIPDQTLEYGYITTCKKFQEDEDE